MNADRKGWCTSDNVVLAPGPLPKQQQGKSISRALPPVPNLRARAESTSSQDREYAVPGFGGVQEATK